MSSRCLNKVMLIGNLTRDPELRYTPNGVAVCSFGLATNRRWATKEGESKESAQFHRIVAWNQLAELCAQLLTKGAKVYIEGRIQYREWTGSDNLKRQTTEIVIEDMILLDSRQAGSGKTDLGEDFEVSEAGGADQETPAEEPAAQPADDTGDQAEEKEEKEKNQDKEEKPAEAEKEAKKEPEEENKDIPF